MRLVTYGRNSFYFLTDAQFAAAMEQWNQSKSVWVESIEALLPPPKWAVGMPPEHLGLQIGYSWNMPGLEIAPFLPGWVAIQKPTVVDGKEAKRGAVYWRAKDLGEDGGGYHWKEINIRYPIRLTIEEDITSDQVKNFIDRIGFLPIDQVLEDPELRNAVPYTPLLPENLLS